MPGPTTYYTLCNPIVTGCILYLNANYTNPAPKGIYSSGGVYYTVNNTIGKVDSVSNCPVIPPPPPCDPAGCCFIGTTLISLNNSKKIEIKDIKVGDEVLSYNEQTNQIEINKVLNIKTKIATDLIKYTFSNGSFTISTSDHPYYVNGLKIASYRPNETLEKYKFSIEVLEIKIGDEVNAESGETLTIKDIEELRENSELVYTFEVENNHNYYANGVLVHNKQAIKICCLNTVTQQVTVQNNSGPSGCCCLGKDWVSTSCPPSNTTD